MSIAIVKPISVRSGNFAGLRAVIDYVMDKNKTQNGKLVYMSGGMAGREFQDMVLTKKLFGKTTGRQYAHFVQSFHERDNLTPEQAFQIGKEYIAGLKQWEDFQVLMAVHTNEDHLHIHYVINSVNSKDGAKWQCSKQDLKCFRRQSDELCRKYKLHVIEQGKRGHQSYGEHTANQAGGSWKRQLAVDIASCLELSQSKADFLHRLNEYGLDVDFGKTNAMFFVSAGTYGLDKDYKCSDYSLRSYGDFSKENIFNHFKANKGLLELAMEDFRLLQDALLEFGRLLFPDNPTELQDRYFATDFADFDRMTKKEIEAYLKRKKLEQIQKKALAEREQQETGGGLVLATIAETLALIIEMRKEKAERENLNDATMFEWENEFEI